MRVPFTITNITDYYCACQSSLIHLHSNERSNERTNERTYERTTTNKYLAQHDVTNGLLSCHSLTRFLVLRSGRSKGRHQEQKQTPGRSHDNLNNVSTSKSVHSGALSIQVFLYLSLHLLSCKIFSMVAFTRKL